MDEANVVIECRDCEFRSSFPHVGSARVALEDHESALGHDVDWQINRVDAGVERAGADAGICGGSGRVNADSPLLEWREADDES
ncbi:hypothetical protein D8Y22_11295 [Salinadaptatus halalkaliphilus]|uniref:Uncharacterized protein n=1 Tax=Salinadaptatus halalkaliphilus TaxID=2419781 RepID=A0A4S3TNK6_9EURY|nr:hypothetical protein [Salinadaptatus halalkaliphilus]THE64695.1 hypothetical protein D8Y22_11295 [Salinadaptatus halalkaliphilus]